MTTAGVFDARGLRAWLARWTEWMLVRRYSVRTIDTTKSHVEAFAAWAEDRGLTRPEEITKPILERYQRFLFHYRKKDGRPLSYASQSGKLVAIRQFFRWLARQNAGVHFSAGVRQPNRCKRSRDHHRQRCGPKRSRSWHRHRWSIQNRNRVARIAESSA